MAANEYHRYANNGPISNWGHAMFAKGLGLEGAERVSHFGIQHYIFNPNKHAKKTTHIDNIIKDIKDYILSDIERGFSYIDGFDPDWAEERFDDILNGYNPDDIVDSAVSWDDDYTVMVAWEVMDKKGLLAVLLDDGAIVFDADLIEEMNEEEELI